MMVIKSGCMLELQNEDIYYIYFTHVGSTVHTISVVNSLATGRCDSNHKISILDSYQGLISCVFPVKLH